LLTVEAGLPTALLMQCLWPSTNSTGLKRFVLAFVFAGLTVAIGRCSITDNTSSDGVTLAQREKDLHRVPAHISEFTPVSPPLALAKCSNVRPPEALLTPDPVLHFQADDLKVRVSFIVGSDGHVHSAFVLESGGPDEDEVLLHAVRFWRYRPALCNGVPTDAEALVRFSIH
jgi:TonB family protein